jgi:hypothetical protein
MADELPNASVASSTNFSVWPNSAINSAAGKYHVAFQLADNQDIVLAH